MSNYNSVSKPSKELKFQERQLQSGETGTVAIVATSRISAKCAAFLAMKKLGKTAKICVHYDPANHGFEQNWVAYSLPEVK